MTGEQPRTAPRNTARQLVGHLRGHGLTRIYAAAHDDIAIVSLPEITIWVRPRTLTWTHQGQVIAWLAADTAGAARHLIQLLQPPATPPCATGGSSR
jgi:hypothetical protein